MRLASDCGSHVRSFENAGNLFHTVVKREHLHVCAPYIPEQHAQIIVESLFGWGRGWTIMLPDQHKKILGINDLVIAYTCGA